ncbi:MAG: hypothetical protein US83_C0003G0077 [Candidatus Falkowbacteria bacterium GW2011_GWC2_38_22]|uniref:Peptidase S74 domain-containing protein n=1 Tax=Candidatus Falkowbacteria bacterium GW2011_GWE1_38_31 TaxID=1618638 RepID=A0A0G0JXE0_9BACT|nr:MAG: hypothetical protein US73_C0001G0169 [Candidatus Falkowbacteria bacterium GW2011_GWF2_38_1205]KKQ61828.1 MAG: hypothetical protein US83_C0003G0077 [Candidatus Falkowbacteria bacterium GW2011_GWC2_38_22]KKQ64136.1 MAG: hypothetical protein US84_C0002G0168 [Candidatus Falkowbacteria bacterium GW2011_GWF1_38_22]KKQ66514.1 MAG: hypothetical protein US87_C0001G0035 [Candidatus Falkowbacteria bacterium GW2011_GWE2_38_254]KKQ71242.1 MAG: hypothetical protein US91_C0001G0169 [Candidatus Falkowb
MITITLRTKQILILIVVLALVLSAFPARITYAAGVMYLPGETISPACGPTESGCGVRASVYTADTMTDGALLFATSSTWSLLSAGADGQVLKLSGGLPSWGNDDGGTSYTAGSGLSLGGSIFSLDRTATGTWSGLQTFGGGISLGGNTYTNLAGTGLSFSGGALSTALGITIESSEITDETIVSGDIADGTITFGKIASNSCGANEIMKWNGSAWACSTDNNNTYTANTGLTLSSGAFSLDINGLSAISSVDATDTLAVYTASGLKKITRSDMFSDVLGAMNYRGTWNATTNYPDLSSYCVSGTKGHYYVVGTSGTTNLSGIASWSVNDWAVCNGTAWEKVQTTNAVTSVFGRTGAVIASGGDYNASQITNSASGNIAAITVQNALNELDNEKLSTTLNSGLIFIGNSSNQATGIALSGDATINNAGVITIGADKVTLGTDTMGNYVATLADSGAGLFTIANSGMENAGVTLSLVDDILNFTKFADALTLDNSTSITLGGNDLTTAITSTGLPKFIRTAAGQWMNFADGTDSFGIYNISGTPEALIAADKGSLAVDTNSGALYIKTTDSLNTGWSAFGLASSGITSLNGLTGSTQTFATSTSGTDFAITSDGTTHTFSIPDASATARGLITTGTQAIVGAKTLTSNLTLSGSAANIVLGSNYLSGDGDDEGIYINSSGNIGIGTTITTSKLTIKTTTTGDGIQLYGDGNTSPFFKIGSNSNYSANARNYGFAVDRGLWGDFSIFQSSVAQGDPYTTGTAVLTINKDGHFSVGASTIAGTLGLTGDLAVNTDKFNINATSGNTTVGGTLTAQGAVAYKKGSDFSTTETSINVDFGNTSLVRLTGASAQTIDTIAGGTDGKVLTIVNAGANSATIKDSSTASGTVANKIYTGTGADMTLAADASLLLIYDSGASRWRVVGGSGSGGLGGSSIQTISSTGNISGWGYTVKADGTSASFTTTLPTASGNSGKLIEIVKTDNTANALSISPYGSETINGSTNKIYLYSQGDSVVIRSDGSNSYIVSDNRSSVGQSKGYMFLVGGISSVSNGTQLAYTTVRGSYGTDIAQSGNGVLLKAGKTYKLTASVSISNSANAQLGIEFYNTTAGVTISSSGNNALKLASNASNNYSDAGDLSAVFTPTVDSVVVIRAINSTAGVNASADNFDIEVISTSQNVVNTVEYIYAKNSAGQTLTGGSPLTFNTTVSGNINKSNNNTFTLKAGKTYRLEGTVGASTANATAVFFQWRDTTNNTYIGNVASRIPAAHASTAGEESGNAIAIYTPTTDVTVQLWSHTTQGNLWGQGATDNADQYSWIQITQIGSTASTGVALNSLIAATASGALDNTNYGQTWDWSTATTQTGLTMTGNALTTGGLLSLTSSNASLNSTNGLLYVANTGASTNGIVARIQSNSTVGSGLTVLANGHVGIGTTTPIAALHVYGTDKQIMIDRSTATSTRYGQLLFADGGIENWSIGQRVGDQKFHIYKTLATAGEVLTIDTSGNIGIGTTSPGTTLDVNGTGRFVSPDVGTTGGIVLRDNVSNDGNYLQFVNNAGTSQYSYIQGLSSGGLAFMGGNVGIGTTDPSFALSVTDAANSEYVTQLINTGTTPHGMQIQLTSAVSGSIFNGFFNFSNLIGSITYNGTGVNYNQTSDERLKENIVDTHFGVLDLMKVNVRDFEYKNDSNGQTLNGFIAQELQKIYPDAVTVGTDEVDDNGNLIHPWMVDYGRLTPLIVKSIQDQQTQIEALKTGMAVSMEGLDGLVLSGGLTIAGEVDMGKDTVGEAVIKAGDTSVLVVFENKYTNQPVITITKMTAGVLSDYYVSDITVKGFKINIDPAQTDKDIYFSWHAFGSNSGVRLFSDGLKENIEAIDPDVTTSPEVTTEAPPVQSGDNPIVGDSSPVEPENPEMPADTEESIEPENPVEFETLVTPVVENNAPTEPEAPAEQSIEPVTSEDVSQ